MVVCLDDITSIVIFFCNTGQYAYGFLLPGSAEKDFFGNCLCDQDADEHEDQEKQCQRNTVEKHYDQRTDDGAHCHNQLQKTGLHDFRYFVKVAGDTAQDFAGFVPVKKPEGQTVQFFRHLAPQAQNHIFGHVRHQIRLQVVKDPGKEILYGKLNQFPAAVFPGERK